MDTQKASEGRTKGKTTGRKAARPATRVAETAEADVRALQHARLTAAAWVAAIRVKVLELVHEAGALDNLQSHPDAGSAAVALRYVLDAGGVGKFVSAAYALEETLDDLLTGDAEPSVPDLAAACREAGEAGQQWFEAVQAERGEGEP